MENIEKNNSAIGMAESIESKYRVNHVESGLPRWLIEAAFVCYLLQAAINWSPLMHWMEAHAPLASAVIQTFGALVMYFGLMRGMKPLYRPMTVAWWIVIALNIAGFLTSAIPAIMYTIGLPVAVSLMLVYLPFGCAIAFCYRGRLRQVSSSSMRGCNDGFSSSEALSFFALQRLRLPILQRSDAKTALHLGLEGAPTTEACLCTHSLYRPMRFFAQ